MRWSQQWQRSAIGILAGTCLLGAALSACGTSAGTGAAATSPIGSTAAGSTQFSGTTIASTSGASPPLPSVTTSSAQPVGPTSSAATPPSSAGPAAPTSTSPTAPPSATSSSTAPPRSTAPPHSSPVGLPRAELTLTGTVEEGVEASCLLLKDENTGMQVNLAGGRTAVVRVGARVTVVGRIRTDLMSYCQQGPIFEVSSATAR